MDNYQDTRIKKWLNRCERKARYRTLEKAERNKHGMRAYYCRDCFGFHLTSKELKK